MGKSKNKAAPGAKTGAAQMKKLQTQFSDNSAHSQRMRLLAEIEARQSATIWTQGVTDCGRKHRIARYVLRKVAP